MFGSHKKQGREAGLATRHSFAAVSLGSSLFEFGAGFRPTLQFLRHPYVLAFSTTSIGLMMKLVFKGEGWSYAKKGEFAEAANQEFSMNNPGFTQRDWLSLMQSSSQSPDFAKGKDHAEGVFFATARLISPTSMEPLAIRARDAAMNLPPPADIGSGMLWVTVRDFLYQEFPK